MLVAAIAWWFSFDISVRFQSDYDPGPRMFPRVLAVIMFAGGLWETIRGVWSWRKSEHPDNTHDNRSNPIGVAAIGVVVACYFATMYLIGYIASSLIFGVAIMVWFQAWANRSSNTTSNRKKWAMTAVIAIAATAGIVFGVYLLFWFVFRKPLPQGVLFV